MGHIQNLLILKSSLEVHFVYLPKVFASLDLLLQFLSTVLGRPRVSPLRELEERRIN
jgi:hypothetical protein